MMPCISIGELAERTGVNAATLRMWEQRHGFPLPRRLESGHRRYAEGDVATVQEVLRRRDEGTRLDVAIRQAIEDAMVRAEPGAPSIYAELRRRHPHLATNRLRKSTLLALSWAIEDEFCAKANRAHLFGSFQHGTYFAAARERWDELARVARSTFVFADFAEPRLESRAIQVPLADDAPLRREWAIICDSVELPVALTAWELPGQSGVRDRNRIFESVWTVEPAAVRDASRACARIAGDAGAPEAARTLFELAGDPTDAVSDLASVTSMFNRVVAYVDQFGS